MQRNLINLIFLSFLCYSQIIFSSTPRDPYDYLFEQSLGDLTEELEIAQEEGKKAIFMFFEMDECPFCHRMKNTVLNRPDIQDHFLQNFHSLTMDIEGDLEVIDFSGETTTQKAFSSKHRVRATPVLAFFDLQGNQIFRYTGAPSGPEEFKLMSRYVLDEVYKEKDENGRPIRFSRYKRLQKAALAQ